MHAISLRIQKGKKIVILGENGCGKTTLSKLFLGLYPADNGRVAYDEVDVREIDKNQLYHRVSAIAQDFTPYHLTLRENVAISDVSMIDDDERVTRRIAYVGLESIIPEVGGLDGQMGRELEGAELSGGQWQKLAVSRALFKDSELIILDEPTSALDPMIEKEILDKFIEIAEDKTAIIISHRVGLCRFVDRIVVMKDGAISEVGSHDELIRRAGEYYRLYTSQQQWYV